MMPINISRITGEYWYFSKYLGKVDDESHRYRFYFRADIGTMYQDLIISDVLLNDDKSLKTSIKESLTQVAKKQGAIIDFNNNFTPYA